MEEDQTLLARLLLASQEDATRYRQALRMLLEHVCMSEDAINAIGPANVEEAKHALEPKLVSSNG
jgi:hypothetical protein